MTTKRITIDFQDGLPVGTRGHFTLDGERWIALPHTKYVRLLTIIDRMMGANNRIRTDMIRWLNHWPDDAVRVTAVLEIVGRTEELGAEVLTEKTRSATM